MYNIYFFYSFRSGTDDQVFAFDVKLSNIGRNFDHLAADLDFLTMGLRLHRNHAIKPNLSELDQSLDG